MSTLEPLARALSVIEERAADNLSVSDISRATYLSGSHLQRLFRLAFGLPLITYVRGRKLAHSLQDLLGTQTRVIDIAHRYGFGHEQSYIRAFRREFGCTPGYAREHRTILAVRRRIDPASLSAVGQGILAGPDIVMVPSFHIVGRPHVLAGFDECDHAAVPNRLASRFVTCDVPAIAGISQPPTFIGLSTIVDPTVPTIEYFAGAQVSGAMFGRPMNQAGRRAALERHSWVRHVAPLPQGLEARSLPTRLCALFRYVGEHDVTEITMDTARSLYDSITAFFAGQSRYHACENWYFERIDSARQDTSLCQMEWLCPVAGE